MLDECMYCLCPMTANSIALLGSVNIILGRGVQRCNFIQFASGQVKQINSIHICVTHVTLLILTPIKIIQHMQNDWGGGVTYLLIHKINSNCSFLITEKEKIVCKSCDKGDQNTFWFTSIYRI